jgi:hypothetical protein
MGIDCLIYFVLTVVIPAKLTHAALKEGNKEDKLLLWGHYWALYFALSVLRCYIGFLN